MKSKYLKHSLLAISIIAMTSGCGGGSGEESAPPAPSTPAPTPTPTTFSVVAVGPLLSTVLIDANGNGQFGDGSDGNTPTSMTGTFGTAVTVAKPSRISGTIPASPLYRMQALGVDSTMGFAFSRLRAPVGASVISPLSTVIDAHGNQATVRNALGLSTGPMALRSETNLLTFNPVEGRNSSSSMVSEDAARITTINMQILALGVLTKDTNGDSIDASVSVQEVANYLAQIINENGDARLTEKSAILAALNKSRNVVSSPPGRLEAAADLLQKYFSAMPERLSDDTSIEAWAYAYRFYVLPEIAILLAQWPNPATARISSITEVDIQTAVQTFASASVPAMTDYVGITDYRELNPFSVVPYSYTAPNDCSSMRALFCNDYVLFSGMPSGVITSVINDNPSEIAVSLSAQGVVTVSRVGSFIGLSSFTYTGRSPEGFASRGQVYVRVRDTY
ncbi:hypothetical protein [Sphingobium sp. TomTYG75]